MRVGFEPTTAVHIGCSTGLSYLMIGKTLVPRVGIEPTTVGFAPTTLPDSCHSACFISNFRKQRKPTTLSYLDIC